MSRYKIEQRRIAHRGREFHFVSYEGQPADLRRERPATDATWYLMSGGKRWPVMPHVPEQDPDETDRLFRVWLERHVFG